MKSLSNNIRSFAFKFVLRLVPAYLAVALLFFIFGPFYSRIFVPLIPYALKLFCPEYQVKSIYFDHENNRISCDIGIPTDVVDEQGISHRAEIKVKTNILPSVLYVYPVFLFSIQLAWPGLRRRDRLLVMLMSLPFFFFIELIDIPLTLLNQMEHQLLVEGSIIQKLRLFLIFVFNNGGRQFAALITALVTIRILRFKDTPVIQQGTQRNAPCPCGSGKKFKHCCMDR